MIKGAEGPVEVQDLQFRLQCKLDIFGGDSSNRHMSHCSCLAIASRFGILFVASYSAELLALPLKRIHNADFKGNEKPKHDFVRRTLPIPAAATHISINCDQSVLAVVYNSVDVYPLAQFYSVQSFFEANIGLLGEVRLSNTVGTTVFEINWNPGIRELFTVCKSDGSLIMCEIHTDGNITTLDLPPNAGSRCFCWSPKGKQIAVGRMDGSILQLKPDLKAVKTIAAPVFSYPVQLIHLQWISNFQFIGVYASSVDRNIHIVVVDASKNGEPTFTNYDDICYSNGTTRALQFYTVLQQIWNLLFVASSNAIEVSVMGTTVDAPGKWTQWIMGDAFRAELPMMAGGKESLPIGMVLDTSNVEPFQLDNVQIPPPPILIVLSHVGVLCAFKVINTKQGALAICSAPDVQIPDTVWNSIFQQPSAIPTQANVESAPSDSCAFSETPKSSTFAPPPVQHDPPACAQETLTADVAEHADEPIETVEPTLNEQQCEELYGKAVKEECVALESQLKALLHQGQALVTDVGTELERESLVKKLEDLQQFFDMLAETTASQRSEIHQLKQDLLQHWVWYEEVKSSYCKLQNEDYELLRKSEPLDAVTVKQRESIQHKIYYVESQISDARLALDEQWAKFQEYVRNTCRVKTPTLETIFQTMVRQNAIAAKQKYILKDIASRLKGRPKPVAGLESSPLLRFPAKHQHGKDLSKELAKLSVNAVHQDSKKLNAVLHRKRQMESARATNLSAYLRQRDYPHIRLELPPISLTIPAHILDAKKMEEYQSEKSTLLIDKSLELQADASVATSVVPPGTSHLSTSSTTNQLSGQQPLKEIKPFSFISATVTTSPSTSSATHTKSSFVPVVNPVNSFSFRSQQINVPLYQPSIQFSTNPKTVSTTQSTTSSQMFAGASSAPKTAAVIKEGDNISGSTAPLTFFTNSTSSSFTRPLLPTPTTLFSGVSLPNYTTASTTLSTNTSFTSGNVSTSSNTFSLGKSTANTSFSFAALATSTSGTTPLFGSSYNTKSTSLTPTSNLFAITSVSNTQPQTTSATLFSSNPTSSPLAIQKSQSSLTITPVSAGSNPSNKSLFGYASSTASSTASTKTAPNTANPLDGNSSVKATNTKETKTPTDAVLTTIASTDTPISASGSSQSNTAANVATTITSPSIFSISTNEITNPVTTTPASNVADIKVTQGSALSKSGVAVGGSPVIPALTSTTATSTAFGAITTTASIFSTVTVTTAAVVTSTPLSQPSMISSTTSTPTFGSVVTTTTTSSVFGQTVAWPGSTSAFFSSPTTNTPSVFGQPTTPSQSSNIFGSPILGSGGSLFAQSTTPVTSAAPGSLFAAAASPVTSASTGVFGTAAATSPIFGQPTTTTATQPASVFGAATPQQTGFSFGSAAGSPTSTSTFGTSNTANVFGSPQASQPTPMFGNSAGSGSVFGNTATTVSTGGSVFGSPTFGQTPSVFGAPATPAQSAQGGSLFAPASNAMATGTSTGSLFGTGSVFDNSQKSVFGTQPLFGGAGSTTQPFGSPPTSTSSVFGQTPANAGGGSVFGGQAFGSGGGGFGTANTATSPSTFGSVFGANQATTTASSTFGFAQAAQPAGATATGSFGFGGLSVGSTAGGTASPAQNTSPFGQSNTASANPFAQRSVFGQPTTTTATSLFGSTGSAFGSGFGGGGSTFGSVFGQPAAGGTANTGGTSVFGQPSAFGSPSSSSTGFGSGPFSGGAPGVAQSGFGTASAQPAAATPQFGVKPAFGAPPVFGSTPAFGTQSAFGTAPTFGSAAPTFGNMPSSGAKLFGSTSAFGGSTNNAAQSATFGNLANQNTSGFGALAQQAANTNTTAFPGATSFSSWR